MHKKNDPNSIDIVIPSKNSGPSLVENIGEWINQTLPEGWSLFIYLVNDGSTDNSIELVKNRYSDKLNLSIIENKHSQGRADSRNKGSLAGTSNYIAFFDADCRPQNRAVIKNLISQLQPNKTNLLFGDLKSTSSSFFGKYFSDVSKNRKKLFKSGDKTALTTASCLINRCLFEKINGYDNEYTNYGFEDKDLIIRAIKYAKNIKLVETAIIEHNDNTSIEEICKKMYNAGKFSSEIFIKKHKNYYKKSKFAAADIRFQSHHLFALFKLASLSNRLLIKVFNILKALPYTYNINKALVLITSGTSYFNGTLARDKKEK